MVMFSVPDGAKSSFPMVPDDGIGPSSAMASVNTQMMVSVNMPAIVSPTFVEGASPIGLVPGDNAPFTYVDWSALQSMVITSGVTFAVQPVEIGANQVPLPIGDAALVTCGPFECMMGPVAPEISVANSAACAGWDPEIELQVGLVDNDVLVQDAAGDTPTADEITADGAATDDGIDVGWITNSSVVMTVKHMFEGVSNGSNYSTSGPDSAKGSGKALTLDKVDSDDSDTWDDNESYNPGIEIRTDDSAGGDTPADPTLEASANPSACVGVGTYADTIGSNHRPENCFRVRVVGNAAANTPKLSNYLAGYGLEVKAKDSEVAWGNVSWDPDPFKDLECESMMFMAADQVDVCAMFEEEVDQAVAAGWGGRNGIVGVVAEARTAAATSDANRSVVRMWAVGATSAKPDRFKTLWFDDNLNGKIRKDSGATRPAQDNNDPATPDDATDDDAANALHDLYDDNSSPGNIEKIWQFLLDEDDDPIMGDFGKVDLYSRGEADGAGDNLCGNDAGTDAHCGDGQEAEPDGKADNYQGRKAEACDPDDGGGDEVCDAAFSMDYDVTFADGTFGCSTTRSVTVTCEWDAQGEISSNPPDTASGDLTAANPTGRANINNFAKCRISS